MAVIVQFEWQGLTREQFDEARAMVRWEEEPARGVIVQAQGWDEGTFRACDVWESAEAWNAFLTDRIGPAVEQLGFPGQPSIRVFEAYRVFSPKFPVRV